MDETEEIEIVTPQHVKSLSTYQSNSILNIRQQEFHIGRQIKSEYLLVKISPLNRITVQLLDVIRNQSPTPFCYLNIKPKNVSLFCFIIVYH